MFMYIVKHQRQERELVLPLCDISYVKCRGQTEMAVVKTNLHCTLSYIAAKICSQNLPVRGLKSVVIEFKL